MGVGVGAPRDVFSPPLTRPCTPSYPLLKTLLFPSYARTPLTKVIIESEASGVVSAVYDACQTIKANDIDRLLPMLGWLEQATPHLYVPRDAPCDAPSDAPSDAPCDALCGARLGLAGDGASGWQLPRTHVRAECRRRLQVRARHLLPPLPPLHLIMGRRLRGAGTVVSIAVVSIAVVSIAVVSIAVV